MNQLRVIFMKHKTVLDKDEQDIEDNFDSLQPIENMQAEIKLLQEAASKYVNRRKSINIRIRESDLEAIQLKASKLGVPYQTYINILVHKDAISGI